MKLKIKSSKGGAFSAAKTDAAKKEAIATRLNIVSQRARTAQLSGQTTPEPPAPQSAPNVKLTIKKKGCLTLNGKGAQLPALPDEDRKWRARSFNGRHLPLLQCNVCSLSRVCPKFKAGYECAYVPLLNSHEVHNTDDLLKYMKLMCGNQMKRVQLMNIHEAATGSMPSVETTEAMSMAFQQLKELHKLITENEGEATIEVEGSATVIGQIFSGMRMEHAVQETEKMLANDDAVLMAESVPLADTDPRLPPTGDVSAELVKDAILNAGNTQQKGLKASTKDEIVQSDLSHS